MNARLIGFRDCRPLVHETVFVADTARIIGDVEIGADTGVWFGCVIRGDVNHIRIGARTNIQDGTTIHVTGGGHPTIIGDDITIGHMALLHACTLEHGSFVGMKACVMDGAVVETGAMVAAGALVTNGKRIPAGQLWGGSPARYMRDLTDKERDYIPVSARKYADLAATYRISS
ncbi:gamma carbonic anhydrase family protein [Fodinicurvata sp. EGI_FJ10296]|uniref:gamma carbonic anhydrase family protein n=1 Tax=Fodinicurvata sp. EGI_FJ10296 TaxID=3231908 RepID=UPI00345230D4